VPAEQRLLQRQRSPATALNALQCAQKSSMCQKAHRTVYRTCPVRHRTVRWPRCQKLQRSESNGRVTWLAHWTVSDGAPNCPVRHATEALTNGSFGGWGYKSTQPPHFNASKFSAFKHLTRAIAFNTRHNQRDQILSQVQRSFQSNSD
jgi:nicotinamide mononucleotide adenylyltransferase